MESIEQRSARLDVLAHVALTAVRGLITELPKTRRHRLSTQLSRELEAFEALLLNDPTPTSDHALHALHEARDWLLGEAPGASTA